MFHPRGPNFRLQCPNARVWSHTLHGPAIVHSVTSIPFLHIGMEEQQSGKQLFPQHWLSTGLKVGLCTENCWYANHTAAVAGYMLELRATPLGSDFQSCARCWPGCPWVVRWSFSRRFGECSVGSTRQVRTSRTTESPRMGCINKAHALR